MTNKLLLIFLRDLPLNCDTWGVPPRSKAGAKSEGWAGRREAWAGRAAGAGGSVQGRGKEGWDSSGSGSRMALLRRRFCGLWNEWAAAGGTNPTAEKTLGLLPCKLWYGEKKVQDFGKHRTTRFGFLFLFPAPGLSFFYAMHWDLFSLYINYTPLNYTPESARLHRHPQKGPCPLQSAYYVCIFNLKEK